MADKRNQEKQQQEKKDDQRKQQPPRPSDRPGDEQRGGQSR